VARRLSALAVSGIALALYNPRSRTRPLDRALSVLRAHRPPGTPAIVATDVFRAGESIVATTLAEIDEAAVSMRSLLLVAGDSAAWAGRWLVATRGAA
jgi:precorrin-3B methylase